MIYREERDFSNPLCVKCGHLFKDGEAFEIKQKKPVCVDCFVKIKRYYSGFRPMYVSDCQFVQEGLAPNGRILKKKTLD